MFVCIFACVYVCTISIAVCACIARLLDDGALVLLLRFWLPRQPNKKKIVFSSLWLFFSLAVCLSQCIFLSGFSACGRLFGVQPAFASSCLLCALLCFALFVVSLSAHTTFAAKLALSHAVAASHSYTVAHRLHCFSLFIERQRSLVAPHIHTHTHTPLTICTTTLRTIPTA